MRALIVSLMTGAVAACVVASVVTAHVVMAFASMSHWPVA